MAVVRHSSAPAPTSGARAAFDWLLGRNLAIGVASMILLALSGFATYRGMSDFIIGSQLSAGGAAALATGEVTAEALVIAIVAALTLLMWIALRETVKPQRFWQFFVTLPLYLFLALWSVGFGYGFWWSLIAGSEATRTGLQRQAEDVRDAAVEVAARLAAVQSRLDTVVRFSERQMALEESSGGSCGVRSNPGRGPLWRARSNVRDGVDALNADIQTNWLGAIERDLTSLNAQLAASGAAVSGDTVIERQRSFETASAEIRGSAREIAARSDALGDAFAQEMRQLASALSIRPGQEGFSCYDPDLAARLNEAAADAAQEANVALSPAEFSEGAAGVATAVGRLWGAVGRHLQALVMPVDENDPRYQVTGRDLIALIAALGVDLGLLALAVINPPSLDRARKDAFERDVARVSLVNQTVINELARAVRVAIRNVPGLSFEIVRMHFIAHKGEAFMVTPNIYRCDSSNREEIRRGIAMNQVAGVLDEYKLIRPFTEKERKRYWNEDPRRIATDKLDKQETGEVPAEQLERMKKQVEKAWETGGEAGLFGKARRTMQAAGWSDSATLNPEIWPLVSRAGLTPLLMVLDVASKREPEPSDSGPPPKYTPAPQLPPQAQQRQLSGPAVEPEVLDAETAERREEEPLKT